MRILLAVTFLGVITVMHADDLPKLPLFVSLADNADQGIVRVPAKIGNGDDPANNLYWGCSEGVKSIFSRSATWKLVSVEPGPKPSVLERLVFTDRQNRFICLRAGLPVTCAPTRLLAFGLAREPK